MSSINLLNSLRKFVPYSYVIALYLHRCVLSSRHFFIRRTYFPASQWLSSSAPIRSRHPYLLSDDHILHYRLYRMLCISSLINNDKQRNISYFQGFQAFCNINIDNIYFLIHKHRTYLIHHFVDNTCLFGNLLSIIQVVICH